MFSHVYDLFAGNASQPCGQTVVADKLVGPEGMAKFTAKTVISALAACVLLVVFGLIVLSPLPVPPRASGKIGTYLVAISNSPTTGQSASIVVTNLNRWDVAFLVYPAQVQSNGEWSSLVPTPLAMGTLRGGTWRPLSVVVTNAGADWRLPVIWVRLPRKDLRVDLWLCWRWLTQNRSFRPSLSVLPQELQYAPQTNFVMGRAGEL